MELILIAAMTRDRVIGAGGGLPWDLPDEYEHFRGLVRGRPVLFGRTSYEIFGRDLAESPLIVVSRSVRELPGVTVVDSVEAALERGRGLGDRMFSAGGASIYRATLPLASTMYLSIIEGAHRGDARFPEFDEADWTVTRREDHADWEFRVYERRSKPVG